MEEFLATNHLMDFYRPLVKEGFDNLSDLTTLATNPSHANHFAQIVPQVGCRLKFHRLLTSMRSSQRTNIGVVGPARAHVDKAPRPCSEVRPPPVYYYLLALFEDVVPIVLAAEKRMVQVAQEHHVGGFFDRNVRRKGETRVLAVAPEQFCVEHFMKEVSSLIGRKEVERLDGVSSDALILRTRHRFLITHWPREA